MGKLQQQLGNLNESDALRELIGESEKSLADITPESARELIVDTNDAHRLLEKLIAAGVDMRPEETRLHTIDERMVKNAKKIVAAVGGAQAYTQLRREIDPSVQDAQARWWRLDEEVDAARLRLIRNIAISAAAVVAVLIVGYLFRGILFPPDPVGDAVNSAQIALRDSDFAKAMVSIESGLQAAPTNTRLLVWKGVLQEQRKNPEAARTFDAAKSATPLDEFLLERAQAYLIVGNNDRAIADMDELIARNPQAAEAYYVRATAYEGKNDRQQAVSDLEMASQIAQETGNDALFASARVRLGMLMQQAGGGGP
jgi:tetratricopeptide (TPR) repeat protein